MGSLGRIYSVIIGLGLAVYSFLLAQTAKLKYQNKVLIKEVETVTQDAEKIVIIQKKQAEIANSPCPGRALLYKQLRDIATKSEAKP